MNTVWVLGGLIIVAAIVGLVTAWRHSGHEADLGFVSNQWLSEHRLGSAQDPHR